jgi:hypothetical protein
VDIPQPQSTSGLPKTSDAEAPKTARDVLQPQSTSGLPSTSDAKAPSDLCFGWDDSVRAKCLESYREYFDSETNALRQRAKVFEFQLLSSKITFAVVIALVLAGLVFSAIQFGVVLRRTAPISAAPLTAEERTSDQLSRVESPGGTQSPLSLAGDLEMSTGGIKIKSSVIGLLVLMISMAFFFLYLKYVFPIEELSPATSSAAASSAAPK